MKNCIQNFNQPAELIKILFDEFMVNSVDDGTVLIIQRSYKYNCLPFYDSLDKLWMQNDFNLKKFIDMLKVHKLDVMVNIEEIDCNMSKMNWLLSLNNHQIYPLDYFTNKKLVSETDESSNDGVRQICEGIFKYGSDAVTFNNNSKNKNGGESTYGDEKSNYIFKDRLVFLTIKRSNMYFKLQKFKNKFLYEEKCRFRNMRHIKETIDEYFHEDHKKEHNIQNSSNLKKSNAEGDVMELLCEINPTLKGKVYGGGNI